VWCGMMRWPFGLVLVLRVENIRSSFGNAIRNSFHYSFPQQRNCGDFSTR